MLWRVLGWLPALLLAAVHAVAWGAFFSGGLGAVVAWLALLTLVPILGALALVGAGLYAAIRRRFGPPVAVTLILAVAALWPGLWNFGLLQVAFPVSAAEVRPAATVRLPADVPLRVAWGGDQLATNYHAFSPDQRWAYDLVVEPAFVESERNEDYGCWGVPVLAPTTARVHLAHDGEPDAVPSRLTENPTRPFGNFVALELETGTYLVLAHLQSGSVQVSPGDRVEEGQPLGRCGNSGNTSEPHIHLHHQRQDPAEFPANFAEGLPLYFRDHDGPPMPEGGIDLRDDRPVPTGAIVRHVGQARSPPAD